MRKSTRSAFTLVELIVVITILAILGTIGFMSIKGYTAEAKNAKVTSDLGTISTTINTKMAEGSQLMGFITGTGARLAVAPSLAGTGSTFSKDYNAGIPNYRALNVKAAEFQAPTGQDYKIGATTTAGGRFEMAGVVTIDGIATAKVKGNYTQRTIANTTVSPLDASNVSGKIVTLPASAINTFKGGDFVTTIGDDNAGTHKIVKVARDGTNVTFAKDMTGLTSITLKVDETTGLIGQRGDQTSPVANDSTTATNLPY